MTPSRVDALFASAEAVELAFVVVVVVVVVVVPR